MPAPLNNQNATKPAEERAEWQISLRIPADLGRRVKKAHQRRKMRKSPWLIEAIIEKCERERA